jgi:hypothetical protein
VHNGRVGSDGSAEDIIGICKVDNDDLVLLIDLFPYAYKVVRFKGQSLFKAEQGSSAGTTRILASIAVLRTWNEMEEGCTPRLESWRCSQKAMGFEVSMPAVVNMAGPL